MEWLMSFCFWHRQTWPYMAGWLGSRCPDANPRPFLESISCVARSGLVSTATVHSYVGRRPSGASLGQRRSQQSNKQTLCRLPGVRPWSRPPACTDIQWFKRKQSVECKADNRNGYWRCNMCKRIPFRARYNRYKYVHNTNLVSPPRTPLIT